MSTYTFSTSSGFATSENITLINADIDAQITESLRTNTEAIGDTIAVTFSSALSESDITTINGIFALRDNPRTRGSKIISIYPMSYVKTKIYQIVARFPCRKFNITNIEITGYMDSSLTLYTVRVYDPSNDQILVQTDLTNTQVESPDLGTINNIPETEVELEVQVKITGNAVGKFAYIENIIIYYD